MGPPPNAHHWHTSPALNLMPNKNRPPPHQDHPPPKQNHPRPIKTPTAQLTTMIFIDFWCFWKVLTVIFWFFRSLFVIFWFFCDFLIFSWFSVIILFFCDFLRFFCDFLECWTWFFSVLYPSYYMKYYFVTPTRSSSLYLGGK